MGFTFIRSPHLTPYNGFIFSQSNITAETRERLIEQLLSQLPKYDVLKIDLSLMIRPDTKFPSAFKVSEKRTNLIQLNSEQEIYTNFKPALKRQIKKSALSLSIYETEDIVLFYSLHQKTFLKQNKQPGIPFAVYQQYWNTCKTNACGKLFFIRDNEHQVHAALWLAYDEDTAYYLAGGTDAAYYGSGAMSGLMWHGIQWALRMNKKTFDFEGSMLPSIDRFFKNFSPQEVHYLQLKKVNSIIYKFLKHKTDV